jgi:hypothetical protein
MIHPVILLAWVCVSGAFFPPPEAGRTMVQPDQDAARAICTAMLICDLSIRTLEYRQTVRLDGRVAFESHGYVDERRRWRCEMTTHFFPAPENGQASQTGLFLCDGVRMAVRGQDAGAWVIRADMGERYTYDCAGTLWGRWLDRVGQQRLGELLLSANDLEVSAQPGTHGPVLRGTVVLWPLVALLEVEVDPDHGFMPRRIVVRDRALHVAYYTYRADQFVQMNGCWLPTRGSLHCRFVKPFEGDQGERFRQLVAEAGLDADVDLRDPNVQRAYARIVREAFGADEAPSEQMTPDAAIEIEYLAVNREFPDDLFWFTHTADDTVFDALRDLIKQKGSDQWTPQ